MGGAISISSSPRTAGSRPHADADLAGRARLAAAAASRSSTTRGWRVLCRARVVGAAASGAPRSPPEQRVRMTIELCFADPSGCPAAPDDRGGRRGDATASGHALGDRRRSSARCAALARAATRAPRSTWAHVRRSRRRRSSSGATRDRLVGPDSPPSLRPFRTPGCWCSGRRARRADGGPGHHGPRGARRCSRGSAPERTAGAGCRDAPGVGRWVRGRSRVGMAI